MKKISRFCILVILFCMTFFVLNFNYTREIIRIREMDRTSYSFDFYLKDSLKNYDEILPFFKELSRKYQISIIKTDVNQEVVKAGVFDKATFPYQEFGLKKIDFFQNSDGIYSNKDAENLLGHIPTFLQAKTIRLVTLDYYSKDKSHSVNGSYRVTTTQSVDQAAILKDLAGFFELDLERLTTPIYAYSVEFLNQDILIGLVVCFIAILLLILTSVYQPLMSMKDIGVKKLLGYQNFDIFKDAILPNIIMVALLSLVIDLLALFVFDYTPKNLLFVLLVSQLAILQLYILSSLFSYACIQRITPVSMLKGYLSFRLGLVMNYGLKVVMLVLMAAVSVGIGKGLYSANQELAYLKQWEKAGNYLVLETVKTSDSLWQNTLSGSQEGIDYYYDVYKNLTETMSVNYARGGLLKPSLYGETSDREYEVFYANATYLNQLGIPSPQKSNKKQVLLPASYQKNESEALQLAKVLVFSSLQYEEQQKTSVAAMEVEIHYYAEDYDIFPFNENFKHNFHNPIISLVEDQSMLWEEKAYLSSSGLASPIKIKNSQENQAKIEQVAGHLSDDSSFIFSSIRSIQQGKVDTYRDAVRNFHLLLGIFSLLSLSISYFLMVSLFIWRKKSLLTMKFLGWRLVDRYKWLLLSLLGLYLLPLPAILLLGKSYLPLLIFAAISVIDLLMILLVAVYIEQKNLNQGLKGELT